MFYKYHIYIYHIYPQYPSANDLHLHFSLGSPVPPQRKLSVPTLFQTFLSDSKVAITIDLAFRILRQQETFKLIWEAILEKGNQKYNRNSSRFLQLQRRRRQKSNTNVQGFFHRIFLRRHLSKSTLVTRTGINFFKDAENHWTFFPRQRSSEVQGEKVVFVAGSGMSWAKQYLIQKSVWSGSPSLGLVESEEKADVFQPQKEDRIPNFMAKLKEQRLHDISMHVLDNDAVICGRLEVWRLGWLVKCFEKQVKSNWTTLAISLGWLFYSIKMLALCRNTAHKKIIDISLSGSAWVESSIWSTQPWK